MRCSVHLQVIIMTTSNVSSQVNGVYMSCPWPRVTPQRVTSKKSPAANYYYSIIKVIHPQPPVYSRAHFQFLFCPLIACHRLVVNLQCWISRIFRWLCRRCVYRANTTGGFCQTLKSHWTDEACTNKKRWLPYLIISIHVTQLLLHISL